MELTSKVKNLFFTTGIVTSMLVTDGLYNNLSAQTLKNNNTIYVNDYTKEEINLPKTRDKILQGLSPEIQKETMRIWNNVLQSPYAQVYMRSFAKVLSREKATNEQKAYSLIIIGNIYQDSKLTQNGWKSIENDKVLSHLLNNQFKLIKSSINIILLDQKIAEADKTIEGQESIKKTLDMIEAEFKKHLEK